jgi:large subunit ribosomal protein L15
MLRLISVSWSSWSETGSTSFDVESLVAAGVSKASETIKLLGKGNLHREINIKVHAASAAAKAAIEAAGGSVEIVKPHSR